MQPMVTDQVIPILQRLLPPRPMIEMRMVRVAGLGESAVEELIGEQLLALDLELGYCARPGEVDIRTIGLPNVLAAEIPIQCGCHSRRLAAQYGFMCHRSRRCDRRHNFVAITD